MLTQTQLVQLRALARRAAKMAAHASGAAEVLGVDFLAQAFKAFALAFFLLGALLTFALRQVAQVAVVAVRVVRAFVARLLVGGFLAVVLAVGLNGATNAAYDISPEQFMKWSR